MIVAGIMSGTSLDGIDVAIVDITGRGWSKTISTLAVSTRPYPPKVREAILGVSNTTTHTAAISRLNVVLGELYARAVLETCRVNAVPPQSVELIGCHGQTIFHEGQGVAWLGHKVASTMQIGEAAILAERTGVPVISNFRVRDMAAGGKGAPLVPYVDYLLFRHPRRSRVALNIGGIANITAIRAGAGPEDVIAFDTGPGNMVVDALVQRKTGKLFDRDGRIAARGHVHSGLIEKLIRAPYYTAPPPKSAGREQYGEEFLAHFRRMRFEDAVATATALSAAAIAVGIGRFVPAPVQELIVSGGGAHNPLLMTQLAALLPGVPISPSSVFGIDVDAKEAIAFAMLAHESRHGRPANLPSATGARHPVILGQLTR